MAYNIPEVIRRILTNSPFFPQYFVVDGGVPAYPPGDGPDGTVGKPFRSIQDALNAAPAVDPFSPLTWFLTLRIMPGVYDEDVVVTRYGIVGFQTEGLVFIGDPGVSGIPGPPRNLIWRIDAPPGPPPLDLAFLYTSSSVMPWDGEEFSGFGVGTLTITGNVLVEGDSQIANAEARGLLLSSCFVYGNPAPQAPDGYAFTFSILELNGVVGTFLPGNVVTSVPSACTGTVISWEPTGPGTGYLEVRRTAGPATGFAAGDVVTFGPNSGTVVPAGVTIAGGVLGNDGSINDIAGTHRALGNGLGVALYRTAVGQDTGGPRFGSVIFPLIPAVTNLRMLLHKASTERDVINEGPWGAGPPFEPLTRIEAEDSNIGGRVSVPTGMIKFEGMKAGGWNMPVGHDFKTYEYIRTSSIAGPISITGAVADFQDTYHPVIDSVIEGPVTAAANVLQVDRVTEYYLNAHGGSSSAYVIVETGGGSGGSGGGETPRFVLDGDLTALAPIVPPGVQYEGVWIAPNVGTLQGIWSYLEIRGDSGQLQFSLWKTPVTGGPDVLVGGPYTSPWNDVNNPNFFPGTIPYVAGDAFYVRINDVDTPVGPLVPASYQPDLGTSDQWGRRRCKHRCLHRPVRCSPFLFWKGTRPCSGGGRRSRA